MNKTEKIFFISAAIACVGVIAFWISGFNGGSEKVTGTLFIIAGIAALIADVAAIVKEIRTRNSFCY